MITLIGNIQCKIKGITRLPKCHNRNRRTYDKRGGLANKSKVHEYMGIRPGNRTVMKLKLLVQALVMLGPNWQ